jgi:hypothetical protein
MWAVSETGGPHGMKKPLILLAAYLSIASPTALSQGQPKPVSLIQLIANPGNFEGQLVIARGYFVEVGGRGDIAGDFLYLNKEDEENLLGDAVAVVASDQMRRDMEKLDHMYVLLTGTFHVAATANGSYAAVLKDVRSCTPWSDPSRPIGLKLENRKLN